MAFCTGQVRQLAMASSNLMESRPSCASTSGRPCIIASPFSSSLVCSDSLAFRRSSAVGSGFSQFQSWVGGHGVSSLWDKDFRTGKADWKVEAVVKRSPKRLKYAGAARKVSQLLYVTVDPSGSNAWKLDPVIELIKGGGVGVIPTDTVYAIVCDVQNRESIDRLYRVKNMDPKKPLSILCRSFQDIDTYTLGFPRGNSQGQTNVFRAAKQCLPGPYTIILPASKEMPKQCTTFGGSAAISCAPRKSVGVRMPADVICQALLDKLDAPLLCTSVRRPSDDVWMLDPVIIADTYGPSNGREGLDFVVDGGVRVDDPSTVIDMTGAKPTLLRRGKGIVEDWMLMETSDSTDAMRVGELLNPYAKSSSSEAES